MKEIQIKHKTYGTKIAFVDDEDYLEVAKYKWRLRHAHTKKGDLFYARAWTPMVDGHRKLIMMHRLIMKVDDPSVIMDHSDNNGLNNQKINLRIATGCQNNYNQRIIGGSSKYKGVDFVPRIRRYQASITIKKSKKHLGYFHDERQAAFAYNWAAKSIARDFAQVNDLTGVF